MFWTSGLPGCVNAQFCGVYRMKRLMLAAAAMLAATLLTQNALAMTVSPANGLHAPSSAVFVHHCRHGHSYRGSACGCGACGCNQYTRCMNCGTCGSCWDYRGPYYEPREGCGCGGCGYNRFYGSGWGWRPFGWLF
jgi:hypothetical protein